MPNSGAMAKGPVAAPGHNRRFSMFSTKVTSTTAISFTTVSGKKPKCVMEKGSFGDWPNAEGVSFVLEFCFSLVMIGATNIE